MDRKTFSFKITNLDFAGRTVEGYANVFGNTDLVGDIVHPGAFSKSLLERGGKVKFLWQHDLTQPLGRVLELREDNHGLFMKAIVSDTQLGRDALALLRDGAIDSFSIGYDSIKGATDYTKDPLTGETIRNLRELRLYEVSLVSLPANELATVTALKQKPAEAKPYGVVPEGDSWCVYKLDEDGKPTGERLGEHATEDEARAQVRALYAAEKPEKEAGKEMTPRGPVQRLGDVLQGSIHQTFTMMCDSWYVAGMLDRDERIQLSSLIGDALDILSTGIPAEVAQRELSNMYGMNYMALPAVLNTKAGRVLASRNATRILNAMKLLHEAMADAGLMEPMADDAEDETEEQPAPDKRAADNKALHSAQLAGPGGKTPTPPTDDWTKTLVEIQTLEVQLLEVDNVTQS